MASESAQPVRRRAWIPRRHEEAVAETEASQGATAGFRVVEPMAPGWRHLLARTASEYWRNRSAFRFFIQRYMRKRYGRTFFGYFWFVIPYVLPLFLGALVFGGIFAVETGGVPYFLYFLVALGTWLFFSQTAYFSTRSLEISRSDIRRLYVPRLIPLTAAMTLPTIAILVYLVMLVCTLIFYVLERGEFYLVISPATLLVAPGFLMLLVYAWAVGLWFSPLAPRARDVRRLAGYVLGIWYFLTPVMYPLSQIPSGWQFLASLNPVTAPIEMVKIGLLDYGDVTTLGVISYFVGLVITLAVGIYIFLPRERQDVAFY